MFGQEMKLFTAATYLTKPNINFYVLVLYAQTLYSLYVLKFYFIFDTIDKIGNQNSKHSS